MSNELAFEAWLNAAYTPAAVYLKESDCVEYVAEDTTCVYHRIDGLLTLIYDETGYGLVGFKLKGFRNFFESIKDDIGLTEGHFIALCQVLERVCLKSGEEHIGDARRRSAYKAAEKIAERDNVQLDYRLAA